MSINALAITTTTSSITSSATTIPVASVSRFASEILPFYVSISPANETATPSNTEIVRVTAVGGSSLTVARGQQNTSARAFDSGVYVYRGIYAKDLVAPLQLPAGDASTASYWSSLYSLGVRHAQYDPDFEPTVSNLPVYRANDITLISSSQVRINGVDNYGKTATYLGTTSGATMSFTREGWYLAGIAKSTDVTSVTVDLPVLDPYGIKVIASAEGRSSTAPTWCELRALDSSGNAIEYERVYIGNLGNNVVTDGVLTGTAVAILPFEASYANAMLRAESVYSDPDNYRSWTWQSTGGRDVNFRTINGGARQTGGTDIKKIQIIADQPSNLYLEVHIKDSATS